MTDAARLVGLSRRGGGFQGAVEMCNNNGACRASAGGVMCPSYRVTREERDTTRGRANSLRLAITGQLGPDAFTSDEMAETLKLCVSCKGCRRECPTGVDMARMKIEVQAARAEKYGLSLHDRLVGYLPRYAPYAAKLPWLMNLRDALPGAAKLSESGCGISAHGGACRTHGAARRVSIDPPSVRRARQASAEVVLFADTFNRYFERENLDAALAVLNAGGYRVHVAKPAEARRVRCAAAAHSSPSARWTRRGGRPSARSLRSRRSCRAACRWSGWSRAACSASATKSRR